MKRFFKLPSFEFFISLVFFIVSRFFLPPATDDYSAFMSTCGEGQFNGHPYFEFYWGFIGIQSVVKYLYVYYNYYNWNAIFLIVCQVLALYLLLKTVSKVILKDVSSKVVVRTIQLLLTAFYVDNMLFASHTRSSLLFCAMALIGLLFSARVERKTVLLYAILFLCGTLIRPESGPGTLMLVIPGYLIYRFDLLHLKRIFIPLAITFLMSVAFFVDWSTTHQFLRKVEPEVEYKLMDKRVVGLSKMTNALDSIKYQAAVAGLSLDTRVLTPDYFRSIQLPGANLSKAHALQRLYDILAFYNYYLFVPVCAVALLLLALMQPGGKKKFVQLLFFQVFTFVILYWANYTGRLVCERHFLNLQLITFVICLFYLFSGSASSFRLPAAAAAAMLAIVVIAAGVSINNYIKLYNYTVETTECYETAMQTLDRSFKGRIIAVTTDDYHLFDHMLTFTNKRYENNIYIMYDLWTYWLGPENLDSLQVRCSCDPLDPVVFFNWLSAHHALYLADPKRLALTEKYMYLVHGLKVKFLPVEEYPKPACISGTDMARFEISKVVVEQ
jgi:hypothetical protein